MDIKKRLVFYFYGFDGYMDNRAIKIHLDCLKHYSHIFDEALFVISVNDVDDINLIRSIQNDIIKCGFKNITFNIRKNTPYCEAQIVYDDIVSNLKNLDGITFFGHTKGITNYEYDFVNGNSIDNWIVAMYYMNLEFMDEVEYDLCSHEARFYGTFLQNIGQGRTINGYFYAGTFYWLNSIRIYTDILSGTCELPYNGLHHRCYGEDLPGNLYKWESGNILSSHNKVSLYNFKNYTETETRIPFLLDEFELQKYNTFFNDIISKL